MTKKLEVKINKRLYPMTMKNRLLVKKSVERANKLLVKAVTDLLENKS